MQPRPSNHISRWRIEGTVDEVAAILGNPAAYPEWWPSVFRNVTVKGGNVYCAVAHAWLPFTLRWSFSVSASLDGIAFHSRPSGDIDGMGIWLLVQKDDVVEATFDWRVAFRSPWIRRWSAISQPLFVANHRWAMSVGELSLKREILRRRIPSDESRLPPCPQPLTAIQSWSMFLMVLASLVLPGALLLRFVRPPSEPSREPGEGLAQ